MNVTKQDIKAAFIAAGCVESDVVMFHSSLKSMGHVEGGAAAVYEAVIEAVGKDGTVAVPSLWYNGNREERPKEKFDVRTSPTYVGTIPETFRQDSRAFRSNDFSHAVCAIGARAEELTRDHGEGRLYPSPWNDRAFAEISPWGKLYDWNALYCFIGVDMNTCTIKHYIESRFVDGLLRLLPPEKYTQFRMQIAHDCTSSFWFYYSGVEMRKKLEERGLIRKVALGNTVLMAIRTRPLVDVTLEILSAAPQEWCTKDFYKWICQVRETAALIS